MYRGLFLFVFIVFFACAPFTTAQDEKRITPLVEKTIKKEPIKKEIKKEVPKKEVKKEAKSCLVEKDVAIMLLGLKLKSLNWEKKYYIEKSLTMQLKALNQLYSTSEFRGIQGKIEKLDQQLKRLSIL